MQTYIIGVLLAILAGVTNFTGQILQKKAINEVEAENRGQLMKFLIKSPVWIVGVILICVVNVILIALAQSFIGAALIPGLTASGFIVLGIGSVKILGEELKKDEIIAIGILVIAIVSISLSRLSIEGDMARFENNYFVSRIFLFSVIFLALWLTLYYGGKKHQKSKTVLMALGAGFPFILSNVWVQPLLLSLESLFGNANLSVSLWVFLISVFVVVMSNIFGIIHFQHAMAEGNASIVIPIQQIPQQISPVAIYFLIYMLTAPSVWSYYYMIIGIIFIIFAGFILSRRQSKLEVLTQTAQTVPPVT